MWFALSAALLAGVLGMDDVLARLAAVEGQSMASRQRIEELDASTLQLRRAQEAAQNAALLSRLDPGPLTQLAPYGGATAAVPDLGRPLLARLQSDGSMVGVTSGRVDPTGAFGNVLGDPVFGTAPLAGYTLTAASANISDASPKWPYWNAWYVLNSGTAPATIKSLARAYERWALDAGLFTNNVTSSNTLQMNLTWGAAAGDITVYLLANDYAYISQQLPSWIAAGVDVKLTGLIPTANVTSATAYVEIVNGVGAVLAQSDPEDILALESLDLRTHLETALQDPAASTAHYWRLRIDVVYPASVGHIYMDISQPQLSWSEDGSLPQFTPAVGRWIPETQRYHGARYYRTSTQSISDVTDTAVQFDTSSGATRAWDTDMFHVNGTPAQFIAPWTGYYLINAGIGFAGSAGGSIRDLWIEANGDGVKRALVRELNPTASAYYVTTSVVLYLDVGEYVRALVRQNSGGALNVLGNEGNTFVSISLIGV